MTDGVLRNHLERRYAVAIFAGEHCSRFLCFDVDDGRKETVEKVIDALIELGFPRCGIHISLSGGKGYHVETFFDKLVRTEKLRRVYQWVLESTELTAHQVEFRPTNRNAIKLPLSVHARTGNICWFVDRDTLAPIERYDYLLEIEQVPAKLVDEIIPDEACDEKMAQGSSGKDQDLVQEGTRHNQMRNIAVYMRQTGQTREDIQNALLAWYERQNKSLIRSDQETVLRDIEELLDWIFSSRFTVYRQDSPSCIRLTRADMEQIMSAGSRSCRRVLFLLLLRCAAGQRAISLKEVARVAGISRNTTFKAIERLREAGLLVCRSGTRLKTGDGKYFCERNQYTVRRRRDYRDSDAVLEIRLDDVMERFDDFYHLAIYALGDPGQGVTGLSQAECIEHLDYVSRLKERNANRRIDEEGERQEFQDNRFGHITAYKIYGRVLFPLKEVARCMGLNNPEQVASRCAAKERWKVKAARQVVTRNFIDKTELERLLKRGRSPNREALIKWLCGNGGDAGEQCTPGNAQ